MTKRNLLFIALLLFQFSALSQTAKEKNAGSYFTHGNSNRTIAEWEPAKSVMVT
jgi:hypothetical protein